MTKEKALEIINRERISNPFTMGLSVQEYIDAFKKRWEMFSNEELHDEIEVAKIILQLNK